MRCRPAIAALLRAPQYKAYRLAADRRAREVLPDRPVLGDPPELNHAPRGGVDGRWPGAGAT